MCTFKRKGCGGRETDRQTDRQMDRKSTREIEKGIKIRQQIKNCLKLNFLLIRLNKKSIKANRQ